MFAQTLVQRKTISEVRIEIKKSQIFLLILTNYIDSKSIPLLTYIAGIVNFIQFVIETWCALVQSLGVSPLS